MRYFFVNLMISLLNKCFPARESLQYQGNSFLQFGTTLTFYHIFSVPIFDKFSRHCSQFGTNWILQSSAPVGSFSWNWIEFSINLQFSTPAFQCVTLPVNDFMKTEILKSCHYISCLYFQTSWAASCPPEPSSWGPQGWWPATRLTCSVSKPALVLSYIQLKESKQQDTGMSMTNYGLWYI